MSEHDVYGPPHVIAVCGLAMEARIAEGDDAAVVCSHDPDALAAGVRDALTPSTRGIISFGLAGALEIGLRPGACIIASGVVTPGEGFSTDLTWSHRMLALMPTAIQATIFGADRAIQSPAEKRLMHTRTGALAVDMESHIAGRVARDKRLPFAVVRVVVDPAEQQVPKAALAGQRADGTADPRAVAAALWERPRELPAVMRLAYDAWVASRALLRCRRQLGEGFAFVDVRHHPLDVA